MPAPSSCAPSPKSHESKYARLMGFPDNWCSTLPLYDQHPAFGNAVVPQCVTWIATKLLESVDI